MVAYAIVWLVLLHADAILCFALKRRFRLLPSALAFAAWPLVMPVAIIAAAVVTRNMPRASREGSDAS